MDERTFNVKKEDLIVRMNLGKSYFDSDKYVLRLHFAQIQQTLDCEISRLFLLGRHLDSGETGLDLMHYKDYGVSRRHAMILKHNVTLMIQDLRSKNGTYVNGERLSPNKAVVLRDGDFLWLGNLEIQVNFHQAVFKGLGTASVV